MVFLQKKRAVEVRCTLWATYFAANAKEKLV